MQLPEAFISRTKALLGKEWEAFYKALNSESPLSIRMNPCKSLPEDYPEIKKDSPVSWANNAYYLKERPSFTFDPLFHTGCYYVQEASSMYLEQMIKKYVSEPAKALDLCAAPGGKSTLLSSVLPKDSLLVANEVIRPRANILAENLIKWGNPDAIVTNNDPAVIGKLSHFFDVVVADVPCSGEGMFRKDPSAICEWSVNNVQLCAERQRRIIADIWQALKPGGVLIYSTCTYNREENEDNIDWICQELGAEQLEEPHRFLPHKTRGEGFFIAALRKTEADERDYSQTQRKPKTTRKEIQQKIPQELFQWIENPEDFTIVAEDNTYRAIPQKHISDYKYLKDSLKVVSAGITLAEAKGKDLIPDHSLAMSVSLSQNAFPVWELDKESSLKYLHKEAILNIPDNLPKGFVLVSYLGYPLGFVKNIGNRANNLYPQEWRIRMNIPKL